MQTEAHRIDLNTDLRRTSVQCHAFYERECFLGLADATLVGSPDRPEC